MVPPTSQRIPRVRRYSGYCRSLSHFAYMTLTFFGWLSHTIQLCSSVTCAVHYPECITTLGLASSAFARHYSRNLGWFLFLSLLRCFSSGGSPRNTMDSCCVPWFFTMGVSPFGNLRIYRLFAAPRSLSQLVTSFFGSWCQGIHLALLFGSTSWTFVLVLELLEFHKTNYWLLWKGFPFWH